LRKPRRLRRSSFLPLAEHLESRVALSAQVGVNLTASNDPIWTDLHNLTINSWTALSSSSATVPMTSDDYPLVNASISFNLTNYPSGDYGFSYTGGGTVTFSGDGVLLAPPTASDGVTTGTVVVNNPAGSSANSLAMTVTNVNTSDPMDNLHIMMPGYGNGTTPEPMFTPAFLQVLEPFSDLRFLNWEDVNNSTVANWSQRVPPTALITDGPAGDPYEDMITLCNETQKDMWILVPAEAPPAYVEGLAQLIDADLDPNLNVYLEYSNETWNGGFAAFDQVLGAAESNPLVTQNGNPSEMVAQQTAYQLVSIGQTFDQVFGAEASRVRPILAAQASASQIATWQLQFIQQNYGAPSQFVYASAVAPYVDIPSADNVAGLTINQLFADLDTQLTSSFIPDVQADVAVAGEYGLPLVAYEGGQGLIPGAGDLNFAVMQQAQYDPRMYQFYVTMMTDWQQLGGELFDAFQLDGVGGGYGFWGMLPNVLAPGSQKYDALVSMIDPPGDANLDGIVDYADFQAVEANYGTTGDYWEQGDFNDDGTVNWQDLNILRQNLDPAGFTLAQFAQQALFGDLSTVDTPTALEYDGYGVTYASSLPFAASSGTVQLNLNSAGQAIVLGGAAYSEGLGVLANSSVTLALNGQESQFESTIGVDGTSSTGSSVIFDVYGNGQLLYQSPTMTYASGAIPIDVNVAGVTTLTLTVSPAPGSTASADHAVWGDARLVSTANFGSTQPYTLTWQLSQNGTVVSTQTADSFVFAALSGTYTLTLIVTNAQGNTATASTSVSVISANASAAFAFEYLGEGGQWVGTYGTQGYDLIGGLASLPNYATVTPAGESEYTWTTASASPSALKYPTGGTAGIAACWDSATSFTVDVDLTDGQTHGLELYFLDYDDKGRTEQVQISNATTGAVLSTETVSSFSKGDYLDWAVSGNIVITITNKGPMNAVLSGLFFDPTPTSSGPLFKEDAGTEGEWVGTYGTQGYDLIAGAASLPSYATVTPAGESTFVWTTSATALQALEDPSGSGRIVACWDSATSFTVDVDLTDGQTHDLTLYFLDYDNKGRTEQVQISNATTGAVLSTETISSFTTGVYLEWAVSGNILITITNEGAINAVLNGLFLDAPPVTPSSAASATFIETDSTTEGNWVGSYGTQGYDLIGGAASLPSYATVTPAGASTSTWSTTTTVAQALEDPSGSGRIAACWYSATSFAVDVDLTDGQTHDLELYFLDYDNQGRTEQVQISNATTGAVLDTETISSFSKGVYLDWAVSGNIVITITNKGPTNAVLSGLFLDAPTVSAAGASARFIETDSTTEGNWVGSYGTQGYDLIGGAASLPSYATLNPAGESEYTWSTTTTVPQALEDPSGSGRIAACWYSATSFAVDVDLTDGQTHDLELYFLDYDNQGRTEQVQISNATTGTVLDTETISSFSKGVYLDWAVSGNIVITITNKGPMNAVLSGLFFA
jgi:hypothetical protein